jgi:hypothetical protein
MTYSIEEESTQLILHLILKCPTQQTRGDILAADLKEWIECFQWHMVVAIVVSLSDKPCNITLREMLMVPLKHTWMIRKESLVAPQIEQPQRVELQLIPWWKRAMAPRRDREIGRNGRVVSHGDETTRGTLVNIANDDVDSLSPTVHTVEVGGSPERKTLMVAEGTCMVE